MTKSLKHSHSLHFWI